MKYLFFDIECSNCFNGVAKMCEFGYVITDENFKIVSAYDIPMSPGRGKECVFSLRDRMNDEGVELAYDESYYFDQPELPHFYEQIKRLMEDKDTICFAFSMQNDIRYLYQSLHRYHLPEIHYICYDVQLLAAHFLEIKGQPGLKKCVEQIVGPHATRDLVEHLSRDDAKMEMMVMEAICVLNQIDSKTLLEQSDFAKTDSIEFIKKYKESKKAKQEKNNIKQYIASIDKKSEELVLLEEYKGKRYGISVKARETLGHTKKIVMAINNAGGIFTNRYEYTDYMIVKDEDNMNVIKDKCSNFHGDFIFVDEFLNTYLK